MRFVTIYLNILYFFFGDNLELSEIYYGGGRSRLQSFNELLFAREFSNNKFYSKTRMIIKFTYKKIIVMLFC